MEEDRYGGVNYPLGTLVDRSNVCSVVSLLVQTNSLSVSVA
jgi:hypothetical protein